MKPAIINAIKYLYFDNDISNVKNFISSNHRHLFVQEIS